MNFEFLKDLVSLNPIKISYIANNLRANLNFIISDHVRDKTMGEEDPTLLDKLHRILQMYLEDRLDKDTLYDLFGYKLDLKREQFNYLYDKIKQDVSINHIIKKIVTMLDDTDDYTRVEQKMYLIMGDDIYAYIANFLIRECNNAVKFIK